MTGVVPVSPPLSSPDKSLEGPTNHFPLHCLRLQDCRSISSPPGERRVRRARSSSWCQVSGSLHGRGTVRCVRCVRWSVWTGSLMRTDQNIGPARQQRSNVHSASVTTILLGERKRDDFETYSSTPDQTRLNHTIKLCTQKTMEPWLENVKEYPSP